MNRVIAIVQARMGSSRLPGKSLLNLRGKPIVNWISERLKQSKLLDAVLVAIPDTQLDKPLQDHLQANGIPWFAGSENDVLSRFASAIQGNDAELIVRVCADNPLISGEAVDRLIEFYKDSSLDYAYNHIPRNNLWPDGLGAEIVSRELLLDLNAAATQPAQREHCFNYIWDNATRFKIGTFDPAESWLRRPDVKLDIDTLDDYAHLASLPLTPHSSLREILSAWDGHR